MYKEHCKEFEKIFGKLSTKYSEYSIFYDFVKMCAIALYNPLAKNQEMENEYLKIINTYEKDDQELFPKLFGELIMMYEETEEITDILGPFYEKHHFGNGHLGQFFTPTHISDAMAKMITNKEDLHKTIENQGFISMCEPTCGAGGMILSFAKMLQTESINYQQNLLVEATDVSDICAYMTYIQLSLYGIPAIVYCGDTLSQKMRFKLETPLFFLNYYKFKKFYMQNEQKKTLENNDSVIVESEIEKQNLFKEVTIQENCQISLW